MTVFRIKNGTLKKVTHDPKSIQESLTKMFREKKEQNDFSIQHRKYL